MCEGKGSLSHNNREFTAKNIDSSRTKDNIIFVQQDLGEAYHQMFDEYVERYNAKQKRNDRKISDYYEHTFGCKPCNTVKVNSVGQKSFYEDVVQIGKMENSGYGTEDFQLVADCLKEYMENFQKRNPNFYVFNAVLNMDEATPHLHIDYIPVGHYKRGQDTQNGIAQALKEMGFGTGEFAIARWRASEVEMLNRYAVNTVSSRCHLRRQWVRSRLPSTENSVEELMNWRSKMLTHRLNSMPPKNLLL